MNEPRLILGVGELLWDILPGPRLGGIPINGALPVDETKGSQPVPPTSAAISPEEALPIGLTGSLPIRSIPPAGMPEPPKCDKPSRIALLGGAPANFTVMARRLGDNAAVLSRLGNDDLGRKAIEKLDSAPVDTSLLEIDPAHETGRVTVELVNGEPSYTIHEPAAWDFMELTDKWLQLAERADAVCFGSLAQRNAVSRKTIQTIAAHTPANCIRIFDVNLRPPFVSAEIIEQSLQLATVVKMNDDELPKVLRLLGLPVEEGPADSALLPGAQRLLAEFPALQVVAVTRGARGSLLVSHDEWDDHPGFPVKVADGIGAGDAFTAALTHYLLRGAPLSRLNQAGNRWGGWIASQSGAMPALPDSVRQAISAAIEQ